MTCSVCKRDFRPLKLEDESPSELCLNCTCATEDSFIFLCLNCGTYEVVDKELAIMFAPTHETKRQLLLLKDDNVIIEQESCATCAGAHVC